MTPLQPNLAAPLRAGLKVLSGNQSLEFTKYVKLILPLDGFLFWVRADLLGTTTAFNGALLGGDPVSSATQTDSLPNTFVAVGSLHYSVDQQQDPDEFYPLNRVQFTSEADVDEFNNMGPNDLYIASVDGFRFSVSQRSSYYAQSGLYHYIGDAIQPVMEPQIIDDPSQFDDGALIVSNSLPFWITFNSILPVYPSYLIDDNVDPPYCSVDIAEVDTAAIQSIPLFDASGNHWQLAKDRVKLTLFGYNNLQALSLYDKIIQTIGSDGWPVGLMNMPAMRDGKRYQTELGAIAQKKSIEFEVSYYQSAMTQVALTYIKECVPTFYVL